MCAAGAAFQIDENDGVVIARAAQSKLRDLDAEDLTRVVLASSDAPRRVVVDLTPTDFMSTSVLSALTRIATEHRLRLVGVSAQLDRLFGMLGVRGFFHVSDSLEDALADLGVDG